MPVISRIIDRLLGVSWRSPVDKSLALLCRAGKYGGVTTLFWLLVLAPAQAALELRVAIEEGMSQVRIGSSTTAVVRDGSGRPLGQIAGMNAFRAQAGGRGVILDRWQSNRLWIEPSGKGYVFIGDRWYRGRTALIPANAGLTAVNFVDLDDYLFSVVGSEMGGNWPIEALKAQSVASRSYALYRRQSAANRLFDVGDTVATQVYKGLTAETTHTQTAVNATRNQILSYGGRLIQAVFHSSSGGHTEDVENVWSRPLPYLRGVPDYDQGSPVFQWATNMSREQLNAKFPGFGHILSITPERTSKTGRLITARVVGNRGSQIFDADQLRNTLGLKSTWFSVTPLFSPVASAGNPIQSLPLGFQITGRGFGHGLGMSQWGAFNLAQKGYKYQQILSHYYQNTRLAQIDVR